MILLIVLFWNITSEASHVIFQNKDVSIFEPGAILLIFHENQKKNWQISDTKINHKSIFNLVKHDMYLIKKGCLLLQMTLR